MDRKLGLRYATRGLHAYHAARFAVKVPDCLQHHERNLHRRRRLDLARRRLDEVRARVHCQHAGALYAIERAQLAGFENDLQVSVAASVFDGCDLVKHATVFALQKRATRNHHVDLIGALFHGNLRIVELDGKRRHATRKCRRNRRDFDVMAFERLPRDADHRRVHAYGRDMRQAGYRVVQMNRLLAQLPDLACGVLTFECCQIDHAQYEPERFNLGCRLDATTLKTRDTLVDTDLVNPRSRAQIRHA